MSDIRPQGIEFINEEKACNRFKKGQTIFFEGNTPLGLYCVQSGAVKVYKTGSMGKDQIIRIAQPGDYLGYRALIAEEAYAHSAEALEDCAVCFIPRTVFFHTLDTEPAFSRSIMKSLCHDLGVAGERLMNMAQKSVRERVAETLLVLAEYFPVPQADGSTLIGVQLSRDDYANLAGTSTETTIRLLTEFREDGLIQQSGKKIIVTQAAKLRKTAGLV
jgi:CRP/FNR family transcriptional regulator